MLLEWSIANAPINWHTNRQAISTTGNIFFRFAWLWEKYLSKRSLIKLACSWRNKLIILRTLNRHIVTMVLWRSHLLWQCSSSLVKYGWKISNVLLVPVITDDLPALLNLVEMSSCGCKKEYLSNMQVFQIIILSAPTYVSVLNARTREIIQERYLHRIR